MEQKIDPKGYRLLNTMMLLFVFTLMTASLVTFFVTLFGEGGGSAAYYIASIYILCMLLVTASLKSFMDKICCTRLQKCNLIAVIAIFISIMIVVVMVGISFAWPGVF